MADITDFQIADLEDSSDGMEDEDGKADDQQGLGDTGIAGYNKDGEAQINPLDRLYHLAISKKTTQRQMVGKLLINIFQFAEKSKLTLNIDEVFQPIEHIIYDPENIVRSSLVECLPNVALICQESSHLFGEIVTSRILNIILLYIRDQDNQVRQDAQTALKTLLDRELLDDDQIQNDVCNVIIELSHDESQDCQAMALTLVTKVNPYIGDELTEKLFLDRFLELCKSESFYVRRVCASIMGEFCIMMSKETIYNKLLPTYTNLCQDSVWSVRKTSVDVMMSVARCVPLTVRRFLLSKLLVGHLRDLCRWVRRSAYEILGPFISTFAKQFHELICDQKGELVLVHENERGWPRFNVVPVAKVTDILTENLSNRVSTAEHLLKPCTFELYLKKKKRFWEYEKKLAKFAVEMRQSNNNTNTSDEYENFNLFQYYYDPPNMPLDPQLVESIISDNHQESDTKPERLNSNEAEHNDVEKNANIEKNEVQEQTSNDSNTTNDSNENRIEQQQDTNENIKSNEKPEQEQEQQEKPEQQEQQEKPEQQEQQEQQKQEEQQEQQEQKEQQEQQEQQEEQQEQEQQEEENQQQEYENSNENDENEYSQQLPSKKSRRSAQIPKITFDRTKKPHRGYNPPNKDLNDKMKAFLDNNSSANTSNGQSNQSFLSIFDNDEEEEDSNEIVPGILVDYFVSMVELIPEPNEAGPDLDYHCAFSFPAVVLTLGKENWYRLKDAYKQLAAAVPWKVRSTLASSIHEIAIIIGKEYAARDLIPIYNGFIKDLDEVKIGALKHLTTFLTVLSEEDRTGYLLQFKNFLIADNKWNWRLREELVKQLSQIIDLYPFDYVSSFISPLLLHLMQDRVAAVRLEALDAVVRTINYLSCDGDQMGAVTIIQHMRDLLKAHAAERWVIRQTYGLVCAKLLEIQVISGEVFGRELLPYLLELCDDVVPNVRLVVARTLAKNVVWIRGLDPELMNKVQQKLKCMQSDRDRDVRIFASEGDWTAKFY